jgi:hypothetical protein
MRIARGRAVSATVALSAVLAGAPLAAQQAVFLDGFETGTVCRWSVVEPPSACLYESCAQAQSDFWACFEVPFLEPPSPLLTDGPSGPLAIRVADLYLLSDRSASMLQENLALKNSLATVVEMVTCPPAGSGDPANCFTELWAGTGSIGYVQGSGADAFLHVGDLQPDAATAAAGMPTSEPAGCCNESTLFSMWATATAGGSSGSGCALPLGVPERATCAGSPAQNAGYSTFGYPCFRREAVTLLAVTGDEPPSQGWNCPPWSDVRSPLIADGVRVLGILGSGYTPDAVLEFRSFAIETGAVDLTNGGEPLVFSGPEANAPTALWLALTAAHRGMPLHDVTAAVEDDPGDPVDVLGFVTRVEALDGGDPECLTGLAPFDTDGDGYPDTFGAVPPGGTVCWRIVAAANGTVAGGATAQNFRGTLAITTRSSPLASLPVLFLVPPG